MGEGWTVSSTHPKRHFIDTVFHQMYHVSHSYECSDHQMDCRELQGSIFVASGSRRTHPLPCLTDTSRSISLAWIWCPSFGFASLTIWITVLMHNFTSNVCMHFNMLPTLTCTLHLACTIVCNYSWFPPLFAVFLVSLFYVYFNTLYKKDKDKYRL